MTPLQEFALSVDPIRLRDPLAEFLGFREAGEALEFSLEDAGRFAGHLCPTVATAYVMTRRALKELYAGDLPVRGNIRVTMASAPDQFANGPLARVAGYIVGAARDDGFRGLAGHWGRKDLLVFDPGAEPFGSLLFERTDTGDAVRVTAFAEKLPDSPAIGANLKPALDGDAESAKAFRQGWLERVQAVVNAEDSFLQVEHPAATS